MFLTCNSVLLLTIMVTTNKEEILKQFEILGNTPISFLAES